MAPEQGLHAPNHPLCIYPAGQPHPFRCGLVAHRSASPLTARLLLKSKALHMRQPRAFPSLQLGWVLEAFPKA